MVFNPQLKRCLLLVAALTVVVLGATWYLWPEPPIGPASYRRIELGMTRAEVEAVIGLPPGNYSWATSFRAPWIHEEKGLPVLQQKDQVQVAFWSSSAHAIRVAFDEKGAAVGCALVGLTPASAPPGTVERIRGWLGW